MRNNKKKLANPNGGFSTPPVLLWIIAFGIAIAGLIYYIVRFT